MFARTAKHVEITDVDGDETTLCDTLQNTVKKCKLRRVSRVRTPDGVPIHYRVSKDTLFFI